LEGRTVLVTGGSSGTGLALVREAHRLGADIIAGSRSLDRLAAVSDEVGGARFHPFVADLTDERAVNGQLQALAKRGLRPTDLVHSAAGGLEPVVRQLVRRCVALRRVPEAQLAASLESARSEVRQWVDASREGAMRVNYEAPRTLFDQLAPRLPTGGSITFYSSLWSTFYAQAEVPGFYRGIAESKLALENWLASRSAAWAERGITTAIISGHIMSDTNMGELIDRFLVPFMPAEQQARFRSFYVTTADMVRATIPVLVNAGHHDARGRLVRSYVVGPSQIVDHLSADTPALADLIPL